MATTAHMASLTVPGATDDMDLQSDSGYGYEDGDIDIDLESTGDNMDADDDDVVLQDAGLDGRHGAPGDAADIDESMGDDQGLLDLGDDVDIVAVGATFTNETGHEEDLQPGSVAQRSPAQLSAVSVALHPGTIEHDDAGDDIIDYSSDEDDPPKPKAKLTFGLTDDVQNDDSTREGQDGNESNSHYAQSEHLPDDGEGDGHDDEEDPDFGNNAGEQGNFGEAEEQTWDESATAEWQEQHDDDETYADFQFEEGEDYQGDPDNSEHDEDSRSQANGGYAHEGEHDDEKKGSPPASQHDEYIDTNQQQDGAMQNNDETEEHHAEDADGQPRLHSILLNYSGTDMFLFEPHPDQQPQMFLLSDERVAAQSFHAFFQACRTQLGDSVKHDTELGILVKHLRNLEIYEDSIACASFCLKDLLDIYLALHRQDGNANPEALSLKILFRPRVISIFGDLKKAVAEQMGFTGLESAFAAKQEGFENMSAHEGDHEGEAWGEDENSPLALSEHDEDRKSDGDQAHVVQSDSAIEVPDVTVPNDKPGSAAHPISTVDDDSDSVHRGNKSASNSGNSSTAAAEAAEDFIDFAEEEEDEIGEQNVQGSLNQPSSASSTVQGDNTAFPSVDQDPAKSPDTFDEEQLNYDFDETYGDNHGPNGNEYGQAESYVGDVNFDENGSMTLTGHLEAGPVITADGDDFLDGFDYAADAGDDNNFDDLLGDLPPTEGGDNFTSADFVNLDNGEGLTTELAVADGDAGQDASASQSGHLDLDSPQGLKRSIDEVDGGVQTSDSSDDKRVRL